MLTQVETLKQEISGYYLEDFKKELWWFKSIALLPIENKVKDIIVGKTELPKHFDEAKEFGWWRYIIDFVAPSTAKEIFEFMKAKRIEIEKRNTQEELSRLKAEILWEAPIADGTESIDQNSNPSWTLHSTSHSADQQSWNTSSGAGLEEQTSGISPESPTNTSGNPRHNIGYGAWTSMLGVGGVETVDRLIKQAEARNLNSIDAAKMKSGMHNLIENLENEKKALSSRLSKRQIKNIDKTIQKMSSGFESLDDEGLVAFKQWNSLKGQIPDELLTAAGMHPRQFSKLVPYADELIGKTPAEIREIMKLKKVDMELSDDVLKLLASAKDAQEFQAMSNVLLKGKKLTQWAKSLKAAMMIDVACLGLDVWTYLETMDEAELIAKVNQTRAENKKNQANFQLAVWLSSFAIEAIIICGGIGAVGGAPGAVVWLAVWAVTAAVSIGADALYFDTHDFYLQNREDLLRQSRAELRQAVLQGLHNQKFWNQSWNERIGAPADNIKSKNLDEALYSLLFIEEMRDSTDEMLHYYIASRKSESDFLKDLSPEQVEAFTTSLKRIKEKIAVRTKYLTEQFKKPKLINKLKSWAGTSGLIDLVAESAGYLKMFEAKKWDENLDYAKNLAQFKSEFFADFPREKVKKLEDLRKNNRFLFEELISVADFDSLMAEGDSPEYSQNLQLIKKYKERIGLEQRSEEISHFSPQDTNRNMAMLEKLIENGFDEQKLQFETLNKDELVDVVQFAKERNSDLEYSDDVSQNVRYQLAKRLYGYEGTNSAEELMAFFSEDKWGVHGIYYTSEWKINRDWLIDSALAQQLPKELKSADVPGLVDRLISSIRGSNIDTKTEAIDPYLQQEFEKVLRAILTEELAARTLEEQTKVKNLISTFVKNHASNEEYLELPYYLIIEAKRAGLGDLQRRFFTWEGGKMKICSMSSEIWGLDAFAGVEKQYLVSDRTKYSPEQQKCIDRVELAHKKLEDLRGVDWSFGFEDDLDLPKELELIISQKYKDREQVKANLLVYAPWTAAFLTLRQSEEYAQYFESLYKGLLLRASQFKLTNDIDDFGSFQEAVRLGQQNIFDKDGNLSVEKDSPLDQQPIKVYYAKKLESLKLKVNGEEKSLKSLWASDKSEEHKLALRASNLVIEKILEWWMLRHIWTAKMNITKMNLNQWLFAQIDKRIQEQISSLEVVSYIDDTKISECTYEIKTLSQHEEAVVWGLGDLQHQIETQKDTVVWQGKRWNIEYLPKSSEIKSRGHKVKFEQKADKFMLSGLSLELSLHEMLWLANFRNRCVSKYHGQKVEFKTDFTSLEILKLRFQPTLVIDGTTLVKRSDLEAKCSALKDDAMVQKLADWLTKELS